MVGFKVLICLCFYGSKGFVGLNSVLTLSAFYFYVQEFPGRNCTAKSFALFVFQSKKKKQEKKIMVFVTQRVVSLDTTTRSHHGSWGAPLQQQHFGNYQCILSTFFFTNSYLVKGTSTKNVKRVGYFQFYPTENEKKKRDKHRHRHSVCVCVCAGGIGGACAPLRKREREREGLLIVCVCIDGRVSRRSRPDDVTTQFSRTHTPNQPKLTKQSHK